MTSQVIDQSIQWCNIDWSPISVSILFSKPHKRQCNPNFCWNLNLCLVYGSFYWMFVLLIYLSAILLWTEVYYNCHIFSMPTSLHSRHSSVTPRSGRTYSSSRYIRTQFLHGPEYIAIGQRQNFRRDIQTPHLGCLSSTLLCAFAETVRIANQKMSKNTRAIVFICHAIVQARMPLVFLSSDKFHFTKNTWQR